MLKRLKFVLSTLDEPSTRAWLENLNKLATEGVIYEILSRASDKPFSAEWQEELPSKLREGSSEYISFELKSKKNLSVDGLCEILREIKTDIKTFGVDDYPY